MNKNSNIIISRYIYNYILLYCHSYCLLRIFFSFGYIIFAPRISIKCSNAMISILCCQNGADEVSSTQALEFKIDYETWSGAVVSIKKFVGVWKDYNITRRLYILCAGSASLWTERIRSMLFLYFLMIFLQVIAHPWCCLSFRFFTFLFQLYWVDTWSSIFCQRRCYASFPVTWCCWSTGCYF